MQTRTQEIQDMFERAAAARDGHCPQTADALLSVVEALIDGAPRPKVLRLLADVEQRACVEHARRETGFGR